MAPQNVPRSSGERVSDGIEVADSLIDEVNQLILDIKNGRNPEPELLTRITEQLSRLRERYISVSKEADALREKVSYVELVKTLATLLVYQEGWKKFLDLF